LSRFRLSCGCFAVERINQLLGEPFTTDGVLEFGITA
jgi:hypothetical protein